MRTCLTSDSDQSFMLDQWLFTHLLSDDRNEMSVRSLEWQCCSTLLLPIIGKTTVDGHQVVRASLGDITDDTNSTEGEIAPNMIHIVPPPDLLIAFAMYGLVWTVGSIIGNTIGGTFTHPVERMPWLFKSSSLLQQYPFLLPCLITTGFTVAGLLFALLFLKEAS